MPVGIAIELRCRRRRAPQVGCARLVSLRPSRTQLARELRFRYRL